MALALRWHHIPTWPCVDSRPIGPWHFLFFLQLSPNSSLIAHRCCLEWKNSSSAWEIQSPEEWQPQSPKSLRRGLPSGSVRSNSISPKDVWQLFYLFLFCIIQSLLESTHYNLIDSLGMSIPLWICRDGISICYAKVTTISPKGFTIELKSIVRDEFMRDSKQSNNILPNKLFGIHTVE